MNVDKSFFKYQNNVNFSQGEVKAPKSFDDIQKEAVDKLKTRAQREVCEWGNFSDVIEEYENPKNKNTYTIYITPCPNPEKPKTRLLEMGLQIPGTGRMFSTGILRGTKEEILDFLNDEKNMAQISGYAKMLAKRLNEE